MLTSVQRTTEMASLCGGAYIQGAEKHYRRMERVSRRDIIVDAISVSGLLLTVTYYANRAHNLTRSPEHIRLAPP